MTTGADPINPPLWRVAGDGIVWDVGGGASAHRDHLEMSGRRVSVIVSYGIDDAGRLFLSRDVIWPMLRTRPKDERAYLRRTYGAASEPQVTLGGARLVPPALKEIAFDGILSFQHLPGQGVTVRRELFPSPKQTAVIERWRLTNTGPAPVTVDVAPARTSESDHGVHGEHFLETEVAGAGSRVLLPGETADFGVVFGARKSADPPPACDPAVEAAGRRAFCEAVFGALRLETPDGALNTAFTLAKLRAAESVFDTAMGLVHSPGGGNYYGGVWANDQAEYSGPFFPFLGEPAASEAALNAYRIFAGAMGPDYQPIPSSFEVEGDSVIAGFGDRGDAAMVAYGATRWRWGTPPSPASFGPRCPGRWSTAAGRPTRGGWSSRTRTSWRGASRPAPPTFPLLP